MIATMSILHIEENTFDEEVLQAHQPVLVDYWAEWCAPCRMLAPIVEELARDYGGRLKVCKVDIDRQPTIALLHKIMSIPTVSLYVHGKEVKRLIGLREKAELIEAVEEAFALKGQECV
jgi:thioredoxin 1